MVIRRGRKCKHSKAAKHTFSAHNGLLDPVPQGQRNGWLPPYNKPLVESRVWCGRLTDTAQTRYKGDCQRASCSGKPQQHPTDGRAMHAHTTFLAPKQNAAVAAPAGVRRQRQHLPAECSTRRRQNTHMYATRRTTHKLPWAEQQRCPSCDACHATRHL